MTKVTNENLFFAFDPADFLKVAPRGEPLNESTEKAVKDVINKLFK